MTARNIPRPNPPARRVVVSDGPPCERCGAPTLLEERREHDRREGDAFFPGMRWSYWVHTNDGTSARWYCERPWKGARP
jgi:hypothetical protein